MDGTRVDIEVEKLRKLSEEFARKKHSREESPIVNGFDESTPPPDRFRRSYSTDAGYTSDRGSDRRSVDRRSVSPTRSLYNGSESGRKHSKDYTFHRCCSSSERDTSTCEVHNSGRVSAQERWQNTLRRSSSRCRSRSPSLDRCSHRSSSRPRRSSSRTRRRSVSRSPSPNRIRRSVGQSSRSPSPRDRYRQSGGRTPSPDHRRGRSSSRSRRSPSRSPSPTFSVRSSYSVRSFRSARHSGSRSPDRSRRTYHKCCGRDCSPDSSSCALHNKARLSRSLSRTRSSPRKSSSKSPSRNPRARRSVSRSPERSHGGRSGSRSPPRGTSAPRTFRRSSSRSPSRESCIINRSLSSPSNSTDDYKYNNYSSTPTQHYNHINNISPHNHSNKHNGLPPIAPNFRKDSSKTGQGDQDHQPFLQQTIPDLPSYKMPSQRRYSEDNFRKPLATLHEDEVVARRRFSEDVRKKSFDTSAVEDDIYKHQRRLSEAGVRRLSDASVILTEDTDSFIIGDRVWVGGTKGGSISYIGETQFAPGEWAGITLDEPIGKNDGSVAGVRYFQCESKKGVFSRLTRLSQSPLTDQDIETIASKSSTAGSESPKTNGTPTSSVTSGPIGGRNNSTSSVPSTPAARKVTPASAAQTPAAKASSPMTASVIRKTSSSSPVSGEPKIGDRVVINSTTGAKFGVLQYRGKTEFAEGEWAGVELDEPNGKNDGSVAGKRYFDCKQRYGLFAPIARVSRFTGGSATPRRSSTTTPATPSRGLRRSGSRESIGASSVASSTTSSVRGTRVRLGVTSLSPNQRPSRTSTGGSSQVGPSIKALQDDDVWDDEGFY